MTADIEFEKWRQAGREQSFWGLAWYLAFQVCRRYYKSHGIKPVVLEREGLGYYGIALTELHCFDPDGPPRNLGRFSMAGNAENWSRESPGSHGLKLETLCAEGIPTPEMIRLAIQHFELPIRPRKSHVGCRHHRWSDSYLMLFEVMTILALRIDHRSLTIWNGDYSRKWCRQLDPLAESQQHPGYFEIDPGWTNEPRIVISGNGHLLDGSNRNLWEEYMAGSSVGTIANEIEARVSGAAGHE